jgi:hypothetical protein
MRCHYVPQFYLRNFSIPEKREYLFSYGRKGEPFETTINSVAARNNLYILKNKDGTKDGGLEDMFSMLEGNCEPIIEKIIKFESVDVVSEEEKILLSYFIAFLHTRNLSFLAQQKNTHTALMKTIMKINAEDKEIFREGLKKSKIKVDNNEEVESLRKSILNFDKEFKIEYPRAGDDYFIANGIEIGNKLVPYVFNKSWGLVISNSSRVFITSDNPVILIKPETLPEFRGHGFINSHIYIPLSPKISLVLTTQKEDIDVVKIKREDVDYFNGLIMYYAHQFVYSNLLSKNIDDTFKQTTEGESERVIVN